MKELLMNSFEFGDWLFCRWVEDSEFEHYFTTCRDLPRLRAEFHRVLHRLRNSGHQRHPAARAFAGSGRVDFGIHRTDEKGVLARREEGQGHESQDGGKTAHPFF